MTVIVVVRDPESIRKIIAVPSGALPEAASVQAALLDPSTGMPAIQFAMVGRNPDLWYDIGSIYIQ
jgi:hypothetical protein